MNLVVYAVPFFILAMVVELAYGYLKRRNTYRLNDSVSSLFLGILSQARRFVTLAEQAIRQEPHSWLWSNRRWKRSREISD